MKRLCYVLPLFALFGCKSNTIEFEGKTPGLNEGVFTVKTVTDSIIYGENIKDSKFYLKQMLEIAGYYHLDINTADGTTKAHKFEVYLEPGKYTVKTEAGRLYNYPKITSSSKIQNELSAFHAIDNQVSAIANQEVAKAQAALDDKKSKFKSKDQYVAMINDLSAAEERQRGMKFKVLEQFVKQYPNSQIGAHLMSQQDYESDPVAYLNLFNQLSSAAKNSEEGKEINTELNRLVKLVPGAQAPALNGTTPEGKKFDPASVKGKFVLVDFWRSGNMASRKYHQEMFKLLKQLAKNKFTIVSVSIDEKADWWKTALKDDKMTWTQLSDLKGDDSPNVTNWAIKKSPTYYLLDGNWRIVERDASISRIPATVLSHQ